MRDRPSSAAGEAGLAGRRSAIRLITPPSPGRPWVSAGEIIAGRRTPQRDTWRAGAPAPGPASAFGGPADLLQDHGPRDGLIVVHFPCRVDMLASALADQAGFSIQTAWLAMSELVTRGYLTARPDGDGYDATIPGPGDGHHTRANAAAS